MLPALLERERELRFLDAITDFKEFPGRPHFPAAPGWEKVADHALRWAVENASARAQ
jgi:hypothetical protein